MHATTLPASRFALLPLLIVLCAGLTIADISGWVDLPGMQGLAKPLTTLLIALHAARLPCSDVRRRRRVLAGLTLSCLGECAMMLPGGMAPGIGLFILAMGCYLAVIVGAAGAVRPNLLIAGHAVAAIWAAAMWSARPVGIFVTAAVFMGLLSLMAAQAELWWWRARGTPAARAARSAALGGLLWVCADLTWTFALFVDWLPHTFLWVLVLYWVAQWQLASLIGADYTDVEPQRPAAVAWVAAEDTR